jgi:hypothetical protein
MYPFTCRAISVQRVEGDELAEWSTPVEDRMRHRDAVLGGNFVHVAPCIKLATAALVPVTSADAP